MKILAEPHLTEFYPKKARRILASDGQEREIIEHSRQSCERIELQRDAPTNQIRDEGAHYVRRHPPEEDPFVIDSFDTNSAAGRFGRPLRSGEPCKHASGPNGACGDFEPEPPT